MCASIELILANVSRKFVWTLPQRLKGTKKPLSKCHKGILWGDRKFLTQ